MRGSDLVTWGLLIWIGSRMFGGQSGEGGAGGGSVQSQTGACSYGFGADFQSNAVAPYWIRQFGGQKDVQPFTFESE